MILRVSKGKKKVTYKRQNIKVKKTFRNNNKTHKTVSFKD